MTAWAALLLTSATAAVAGQAIERPSLVGTWAYTDTPHRAGALQGDCGTDNAISYTRDGRFATNDVIGSWRIRGRVLIERVTHEVDVETGRLTPVREAQSRSTLRWLSPDHVNIIVGPGEVQGLIRCRTRR